LPLELIICLQEVLKIVFGEIYEAMTEGVVRPYEIIFSILSIEKSDLDDVA
jgi:hypothetical protein